MQLTKRTGGEVAHNARLDVLLPYLTLIASKTRH